MPDVSIITAATRPEHLSSLYQSITAQSVEWEWLVQLDGPAIEWRPARQAKWAADHRVSIERNSKHLGSGATRNQALMRSSASLIMCVDDDDQISSGCLSHLTTSLEGHPHCFGAWGATRSFASDPSQSKPFKAWAEGGEIAAGTVAKSFEASGHFPVHVGAMLWRRPHLAAVGGYAALPRSIDTNPFLACEALFPHVYVDETVYLYRLHPDQMTKGEDYEASKERVHAWNFERARALSRLLMPRPPG